MSPRALRFLSAAATLFLSVCHAESFAGAGPKPDEPLVLHPIHLRDYESAIGLHRRSGEDLTDLDPSTKSQLIYGRPGESGQLLFANMTLYAPDGLPIVLMERFEGLTAVVDCKGDDGAMSLTFKLKAAYDYALKTWEYINENDDQQFLLIANHDGCGPDDERQPYKVSNVIESSAHLTIGMKTTIAAWSEVAGTYDLDFGKAALNQARQRLKPRGFWGDIGEIGKTVLEGAQGNADYDKSVTFDVDVGEAGKRSNIYTDPQSRFSIDCVDCFITGSWQVEGHIVVTGFKLQDLTLSAAPSNFKAKLGLEATVTASKAPESLEESKELFTAGIPGAGIAVKGIFKLGATVSYEVGTSATFAGTATAAFGLEATLPNGAKVVADVNDPSRSSAVGWQRSSLTPSFEITQLSASLTLAAFSQPKISFGIELIEVGNVEIALTMKLPEISSTMSATYDPQGVCAQSAGSSKTGVKLENEATESLSLAIDVDLGDDSRKPSWSKPLLNFSQPLGDECIPLNIPGLAAASGTATSQGPGPTSAAPATCKPPGKTGICQATSKACAGGAYISGYCPGGESVKCCPDADSTPSTTASPPAGATPKTCTPPGKTGICQQTSVTCPGGAYISGYCPGDSSIQCCPAASESTPTTCAPPGKSGICQPTTQTCPGGAYISGYCPGDDSIQCCPAADSTPSAPAPTTCAPPGKTGVCQKTSLSCEGGAYIAGLCPGDDSVKCCPDVVAGEGGGGCKVKRDRVGRRVVIC